MLNGALETRLSSTCSSLSRADAKIVVVWDRPETRFICALTLRQARQGHKQRTDMDRIPVLATLVFQVLY